MTAALTWPLRVIWFLMWFLGQQTLTTATVVRDSLRPRASITPGFVAFRTRCRTDFEVTLLSVLITLTPGTLTLGANRPDDGADDAADWEIIVHGMYFPEPDELIDSLRGMEDHMLAAVRRKGVRG